MVSLATKFQADSLNAGTLATTESSPADNSFGDLDSGEIAINAAPIGDPIKAVSGTIDPRIKFLSYSSDLTLHACPRKYQLYKLRAPRVDDSDDQSITFTFGQVVGEGIQLVLQGKPMRAILWRMFTMWSVDLHKRDEKRRKSFAEAVSAIRKFTALRAAGFLNDLELVYIDGKPACELGFAVHLFDGFVYRGFVDAVLRNRVTGDIIVLECKTTWYKETNPAQFKNSGQALGYSVVLDALFPGLSSYSVLYLVYSTVTNDFTPMPFPKSFESRAEWIRALVFDVEDIVRYEEAGIYPRRGESCFAFFRECEYINSCGFSTSYLAKPLAESEEEIARDEARYVYRFNLVDLIQNQIARNSTVIS